MAYEAYSIAVFVPIRQNRSVWTSTAYNGAQNLPVHLKTTPAHEWMLDGIVWACRRLYNTALKQRITSLATARRLSVRVYAIRRITRVSVLPSRTMPPSTRRCCKMS